MRKAVILSSMLTLFALAIPGHAAEQPQSFASMRELIKASGVTGGLAVRLGNGNGDAIADLVANDRLVVHGLYRDHDELHKARKLLQQKTLYGRASAQHWDKPYLPYTDNLVNLLVADDLGEIPMKEVLRALAPRGVAYVKSGAKLEENRQAMARRDR